VDWDNGVNGVYTGDVLVPVAQGALKFSAIKTAISLPDLVRETNAFSRKYRPGCVAKLLDSNPKALFLHYNVKCNKEDSDPAGHDVRVQFDVTKVQESQQAKDLDIQCSCSCPAFLYWGAQWNLHQRDGLLGNPRPLLQAPTERLDLRGNFVICKHIHAVFERILPSVQNNILSILREREVRRKKELTKETPARLKERQDEMKRKKKLEKIRKIKDKKVQKKMLDALEAEERARMEHEKELSEQAPPGEVEEAPKPKEAPTTEKELPAWLQLPKHYQPKEEPKEEEDLSAIQDLLKQEEEKVEEAHKEGIPHLHKGLPYDIPPEHEEEEELEEGGKMGSLKTAAHWRQGHRPERGMEVYDTRYRYSPTNLREKGVIVRVKPDKTLDEPEASNPMNDWVYVQWDDDKSSKPNCQRAWTVNELPSAQKSLFAKKTSALPIEFYKKGDRVRRLGDPYRVGEIISIVNKGNGVVKVKFDDGTAGDMYVSGLVPITSWGGPQESLFDDGMSVDPAEDLMFDELARLEKQGLASTRHYAGRIQIPGIGTLDEGMDVIAFVAGRMVKGRITRIDKDRKRPELSTVWLDNGSGHRADMIRLLQRKLF
jgi:hypothetical protein